MNKTQLEIYLEELDIVKKGYDQEKKTIVGNPQCWQVITIIQRLSYQLSVKGACFFLELSTVVSQELLHNREIPPALIPSYAAYKDLLRKFRSTRVAGGGFGRQFWWLLVSLVIITLTKRFHGFFYEQPSLSWYLQGLIIQALFSVAISFAILFKLVGWLTSQCSLLETDVISKVNAFKGRILELLKIIAQLQTIGWLL